MRLVLQRVTSASVTVDGETTGSIERGLLVLIGIACEDNDADTEWAVRKLLGTRLWEDASGKAWAISASQGGYDLLMVSQFTLHCQLKGNKPDFHHAMGPEPARAYWEAFVERVKKAHSGKVEQGRFGAKMQVELINDGPVTITLDSPVRVPTTAPIPPQPKLSRNAGPSSTGGLLLAVLPPSGRMFEALRHLEQRGLRLVGVRSLPRGATPGTWVKGGPSVCAALKPPAGVTMAVGCLAAWLRAAVGVDFIQMSDQAEDVATYFSEEQLFVGPTA